MQNFNSVIAESLIVQTSLKSLNLNQVNSSGDKSIKSNGTIVSGAVFN
jgi:hypothetical protein